MTTTARNDGVLPIVVKSPDGSHDVDVISGGGLWRLATDATITVEEILGQDDYADTWFFVTNAGNTNDTLAITILNTGYPPYFTKTITRQAGQDIYTFATYIKDQLNADSNFISYWSAKVMNNIVFIFSRIIAEKGESPGLSPDAFTVVVTGSITVYIPAGNGEIVRRKKMTILTPDPRDPRLGILGVRGEVSSLARADNPIFANIKVTEAAPNFKKIFEVNGETYYYQFYLQFAMGSELGSEFEVYRGIERNRVVGFTGVTGTDILLVYQAIYVPTGYIAYVKKNGTPTSAYTIVDSSYPSKSILRMTVALIPSDTVEIKYDAVERVANMWCQKENSVVYPLPAPVRVGPTEFLIALYKNHSANSGSITFNTNGYKLLEAEVEI